jgi:hypothetical protein
VISPAIASGKTSRFAGPVNQPFIPSPAGFSTLRPAIQLKVSFAGKRPKVIPAGTLKAEGVYGSCVFGAYGCSAYAGEAPQCFWFDTQFGSDIRINKKKKFSGTWTEERGSGDYFTVTGRVSKRSVSGTLHAHASIAATAPDAAGNGGHPAATCDTGVLTWSATR